MTRKIESLKLGPLSINADLILTFPVGIPAFQHIYQYALISHAEGSPFSWLQAVDDPALSFLVTDPRIFIKDYHPIIPPEESEVLELDDAGSLITLVMVSIPHEDPKKTTANLMAPLCINPKNRKGKQVILHHSGYSHQKPLFSTPS